MLGNIFSVWLGVNVKDWTRRFLYWFSGGQTHFSTLRGARMSLGDPNGHM